MSKQNTRLDFGGGTEPSEEFLLFPKIIEDRGSRYSVSIGKVNNKEAIATFLKTLKKNKKYAKATHNSWAVRIAREGVIYESKQDDGETGAGMVILRQLQKYNAVNTIVCVTRWFGGVKLQGDRFRHLQDATKYALERIK